MDYQWEFFAGCMVVLLGSLALYYYYGKNKASRVVISLKWRCMKVNKAFCQALGYDAKEFLTMDLQRIIHPEDLHNDFPHLQQMLDGQLETYASQQRYLDKCGNLLAMRVAFSLVRDKKNIPHYFVLQLEPLAV